MFGDIYDGNVWNELQNINGAPFLSCPQNYCLLLNVDWFNPFDDTQYSVGAIYLVILNLPRNERYKFENVILVGMIPGPKEPKRDINSFLLPLVNDLNELFRGVTFKNHKSSFGSTTIRALLACTSSDLPATRKVCGFLSFNALKGCSKCLKSFPTYSFGEKPDFSGYEYEAWEPRKHSDHKKTAFLVKTAKTATSRATLEHSSGVRYSELLNVPCFDVVRYHCIDPMHNIFLGIAKHMMQVWRDKQCLSVTDFLTIQSRVDAINPPPNIGRIIRKIESGMSSVTADEWKYWILIYSPFALHKVLPDRDYKCWLLLVEVCKLLCQSTITRTEVVHAHQLILKFCITFQELYGNNACTPNMHMACHLKDCLLDYGPLQAFWCFSFERYNGALEGMSLSWLGPEKQMLTKFLTLQNLLYSLEDSNGNDEDFLTLTQKCVQRFMSVKVHSSVEQTTVEGAVVLCQTAQHTCNVSMLDCTSQKNHVVSLPLVKKVFSECEMQYLTEMYKVLYPPPEYDVVQPSRFYLEFKQVTINGETFISKKSRSQRSTAVVAHWPNTTCTGIDEHVQCPMCVGIVSYFFQHEIRVKSRRSQSVNTINSMLAYMKWMENHPQRNNYIPMTIITSTTYSFDSCTSFIPISRIAGRCAVAEATATFDYGEDKVLVCIPLLKKELY